MDDLMEALGGLGASEWQQDEDDEEEEEHERGGDDDAAGGVTTGAVARVALSELTAERFHAEFLEPRRPVVVEDYDGAAVPLHLTVEHFARTYGKSSVPLDFGGPGEQKVELSQFLAFTDPALRRLYLRNLQMQRWFPEEAAGLRLPDVFGTNLLADPDRVPHVPDSWRRWFELFICTSESPGFPFLHQDMCHIHAFSLQIQGSKLFTLFEPSDAPYLYPAGGTNTRSRIPNVHNVSLKEYPLFAKAKPIHVQLNKGEILFVPSDWWHTTNCIGTEPSVTLASSMVDESIYESFMDAHCEFQAMQSLVKRGAGVILH